MILVFILLCFSLWGTIVFFVAGFIFSYDSWLLSLFFGLCCYELGKWAEELTKGARDEPR
ncbi:MAG: hypothetical protein COU51_00780 [Parcubacteria group bacterium CG10_big_fil_rev_8_21_14_0_10_36_14]|nr:MAG: hypothetical protein COU51_00780 [Parcubacteria group bacterium CG10_big_fil_rev_8_21_14_0_10_36_14]